MFLNFGKHLNCLGNVALTLFECYFGNVGEALHKVLIFNV